MKSDDCLEEGETYQASFVSEDGDKVKVSYYDKLAERQSSCVRTMDVDVITPWNPKSSHGPYDFDA